MKRKNLLYFPLILGIGFGFFSCNFGNGGNVTSYPGCPAVAIDYNSDFSGMIMATYWGYCVVPSFDISPGSCVWMSFAIDYDNQPAGTQYPVASQINMGDVFSPNYLERTNGPVNIDNDSLPISITNYYMVPSYKGKVFFTLNCKDKAPNFRLAYNIQEPDSAGIANLYLLAQPVSENSSDVLQVCAFDALSFIREYGEECTLTEYGYSSDVKFLSKKVNLKIFDKMSDSGEPIYKSANDPSKPILLYIFKDDF